MDLIEAFVSLVRAIVGLPQKPGTPPVIDRLALYRVKVTNCASDGSKCDVTPIDAKNISGENGVRIKAGIPAAVALVVDGAIALLGWEGGDPSKPYVVPAWDSATVQKLILNAQLLLLAGESDADEVVTKKDLQILFNALSNGVPVANDGGANLQSTIVHTLQLAGWTSAGSDSHFGSSKVKAQR